MSLCADSGELESSHVTITFSELVDFPSAVYEKSKTVNCMITYFYAIDRHK